MVQRGKLTNLNWYCSSIKCKLIYSGKLNLCPTNINLYSRVNKFFGLMGNPDNCPISLITKVDYLNSRYNFYGIIFSYVCNIKRWLSTGHILKSSKVNYR